MSIQHRLTSKSQVTIPRDVREQIGVGPGDLVRFEQGADGRITISKGDQLVPESFKDRLKRARALANPQRIGMTTDAYMALIREPVRIPDTE